MMFKFKTLTIGLCTAASWVMYNGHHQPNSHAAVPSRYAQATVPISEGRYWIGGTDESMEIKGDRYRYYNVGGEREWRSTRDLKAIKGGVVFDGKLYWCLSTMKSKGGQISCSENGWDARPIVASSPPKPSIHDFIPQGWQLEQEISGDLNQDGQADQVLQISKASKAGNWQRSVLILQSTASGWEQIATAPKLLLCGHCAGMLGGTTGKQGNFRIKDGILIVDQLSGSRYAMSITHRFWIDENSQQVVLIGEDLALFDRMLPNNISDSRNFLTGKRLVNEYRRDGKKPFTRSQTLQVSRELRAIESIDIEAVKRSAPEFP